MLTDQTVFNARGLRSDLVLWVGSELETGALVGSETDPILKLGELVRGDSQTLSFAPASLPIQRVTRALEVIKRKPKIWGERSEVLIVEGILEDGSDGSETLYLGVEQVRAIRGLSSKEDLARWVGVGAVAREIREKLEEGKTGPELRDWLDEEERKALGDSDGERDAMVMRLIEGRLSTIERFRERI